MDTENPRGTGFLACIAYLDGQRPSLVMCRGYYTRSVLVAWNWREGKLTHLWTFDSDDGTPGNRAYRGQGNHNLSVGGCRWRWQRRNCIWGPAVIDDNGEGSLLDGTGTRGCDASFRFWIPTGQDWRSSTFKSDLPMPEQIYGTPEPERSSGKYLRSKRGMMAKGREEPIRSISIRAIEALKVGSMAQV